MKRIVVSPSGFLLDVEQISVCSTRYLERGPPKSTGSGSLFWKLKFWLPAIRLTALASAPPWSVLEALLGLLEHSSCRVVRLVRLISLPPRDERGLCGGGDFCLDVAQLAPQLFELFLELRDLLAHLLLVLLKLVLVFGRRLCGAAALRTLPSGVVERGASLRNLPFGCLLPLAFRVI
jgi:hypothetical protein